VGNIILHCPFSQITSEVKGTELLFISISCIIRCTSFSLASLPEGSKESMPSTSESFMEKLTLSNSDEEEEILSIITEIEFDEEMKFCEEMIDYQLARKASTAKLNRQQQRLGTVWAHGVRTTEEVKGSVHFSLILLFSACPRK
jgi:hypothetical protein